MAVNPSCTVITPLSAIHSMSKDIATNGGSWCPVDNSTITTHQTVGNMSDFILLNGEMIMNLLLPTRSISEDFATPYRLSFMVCVPSPQCGRTVEVFYPGRFIGYPNITSCPTMTSIGDVLTYTGDSSPFPLGFYSPSTFNPLTYCEINVGNVDFIVNPNSTQTGFTSTISNPSPTSAVQSVGARPETTTTSSSSDSSSSHRRAGMKPAVIAVICILCIGTVILLAFLLRWLRRRQQQQQQQQKPTIPYDFGSPTQQAGSGSLPLTRQVIPPTKASQGNNSPVNRATGSISSVWPRSSRTSGSVRSPQVRNVIVLPDYTSETEEAPPIYYPSDSFQPHSLTIGDIKTPRHSDTLSSSVPSDSSNPSPNHIDPFARRTFDSLSPSNSNF